jgi:4-hydroxy 2-oxovalerate aldolase
MQILDTTLREGSYVVNFQFSSRETFTIASKLDASGVDYIETGHGLGLGASSKLYLQPEPDEAYLEATASAVLKAKCGMFFIPGIGSLGDITKAAKFGMDFIRVGTNVTEVAESERYIKHAKDLGLMVFANYMKTYALSAPEVAKLARISESYGADNICIVDSAGGMMGDEVDEYTKLVAQNVAVPVSFHGHNNLGLATSNSIIALNAGAEVIDCSLRGLGRSAGNVSTEIFAFLMKRLNLPVNANPIMLLDIAEGHIDEIMSNHQPIESMGIVAGFSKFHSSFETKVMLFAEKFNVDPRQMIIELTERDKVNAPDEILNSIGSLLSSHKIESGTKILIPEKLMPSYLFANELGSNTKQEKTQYILDRCFSQCIRKNKRSVLNIVKSVDGHEHYGNPNVLHEGRSVVIASITAKALPEVLEIIRECKNAPDYLLVDREFDTEDKIFEMISADDKVINVLTYSDKELITQEIIRQVEFHLQQNRVIYVHGNPQIYSSIVNSFSLFSNQILDERTHTDNHAIVIILCNKPIGPRLLANLQPDSVVIDVYAGALNEEQIRDLLNRNVKILRLDLGLALVTEAENIIRIRESYEDLKGQGIFSGVAVSSGNVVSPQGVIIVDNFKKPTKIVGVADGTGLLKKFSSINTRDALNLRKLNQNIKGQ